MEAAASLVRTADPDAAGRLAARQALASLDGGPASLALLFASEHFLGSAGRVLAAVADRIGPVPLIGCVAQAVAGGASEVESEPAVALWLGSGLGRAETFAMEFVRTRSGGAYGGYRFGPGTHLMICDPFTFPPASLLDHLNARAAGTVILGGMASGGRASRQSRLFLDGRVLSSGAVGASLPDAQVHALVSQGCRPVGQPYTITAARGNLVLELGGRPPVARLREIAGKLSPRDRKLMATGVLAGVVIDEYRAERGPGDFLVRAIAAADPDSGAIAVGDEVAVGQTLQFHVRDADSADADLRRVLEGQAASLAGRRPAGALLFTCNGRGSPMFAAPDHDAGLLAKVLGDIPVAGMFCAGEFGPVGGKNYVHGFTASIAVFPAPPPEDEL